ncbi:hypothetical protein BDZ91DRAFT_848756 [Kalaharituber pfeilii]|nr:hypothetical protein BDZ91DRAFT_848756 [Kalaharituber pfeilii]
MDCSCGDARLAASSFFMQFPQNVKDVISGAAKSDADTQAYLSALSQLAIEPQLTPLILKYYDFIFPELVSRWPSFASIDSIASAFGRILPVQPFLLPFAQDVLNVNQKSSLYTSIAHLSTSSTFQELESIPIESTKEKLLSLYRLLMFRRENFLDLVKPVHIFPLLGHSDRVIRYLTIKTICLFLNSSDSQETEMISRYLGKEAVLGIYEGKVVDYGFLPLLETKRLSELGAELDEIRRSSLQSNTKTPKIIKQYHLSLSVANLCGVLIIRLRGPPTDQSSIVLTPSTEINVRKIALALRSHQPLLITGPAGSGKSFLVHQIAQKLSELATMVSIHLGDQTDAKSLIGAYTSGDTPGTFEWRPGVLTTAVREGRWVLVEDIDKAPTEVLSILLPLMEHGELHIPSREERVVAGRGFRLIATMRTVDTGRTPTTYTNILGSRLWSRINIQIPSEEELREIIDTRYPASRLISGMLLDTYKSIHSLYQDPAFFSVSKTSLGRQISPKDLFKLSMRVNALFSSARASEGSTTISETLLDEVFLEAVDCFAAGLQTQEAKQFVVNKIAQKMQISPGRVALFLNGHVPAFRNQEKSLSIGRARLTKRKVTGIRQSGEAIKPFAKTNHMLRLLEQIAVAVRLAEPVLLVGETGTGKTTAVQQLADMLRYKLTVINLSQQTESGDLLGGYKPVDLRTLAVPLKDKFEELFEKTFSLKRNAHFIEMLNKYFLKQNWARVLALWKEAVKKAEDFFSSSPPQPPEGKQDKPKKKKRKVDILDRAELQARWNQFANDLSRVEAQASQLTKSFAFSFVEGTLVKAARNGDWVLLDEINLAAPDTLESIADLLKEGGQGSILLLEKGAVDRIVAHPDFRIFGCMNPATDVGKRDLPPALRSRFTELYVSPQDGDLGSLMGVVKEYIGHLCLTDEQAPADISRLYMEIKALAESHRLVDGAGQRPHFSLRTLTRTLSYVNDIVKVYGLRRSLFEGFCMSFLTLLDRPSEQLLLPLVEKHLLSGLRNAKSLINQVPKRPEGSGESYVQFRHYWMHKGPYKIQEQLHYIITPFVERNLLNLVRATATKRFPVLIQGPTSSGKTSMIEYLAKRTGHRFVRINNHEHTDLQEYLGTYVSDSDGKLSFQEGVLVEALRKGHWIVLDELNLAPTDVLEALNRLLDDNRELLIPETQEVVRPHKDFMLFATQNPPGLYGGRKVLSRAFRNRFLELHYDDIPEAELETILKERCQIAPSYGAKIVTVYKELSVLRQSTRLFEQKNSFATLRDLFRWANREAVGYQRLAENGYMLLAERVRRPEDKQAVKRVIEKTMKVTINEEALYGPDAIPEFQLYSNRPNSDGIVWTKAMRRLFALVAEALRNNEPVLLVGDTGCGKTTVCQMLAKAFGKKLFVVNAHQNTETGDIIGAQRPIRNRSSYSAQLYEDLMKVFTEYVSTPSYLGQTELPLDDLISGFTSLSQETLKRVPSELIERIKHNRIRVKALFEWADGSLVQAMKDGHFFLLDEISLADDSVLERLNSVLESHRTILLAEKGLNEAQVTGTDGFQFLATMNPGGDYGKKELSPALRNRFTEIWVPPMTDLNDITSIVASKLSTNASKYVSTIVNFAHWFSETYRSPSQTSISIRDILSWVKFVNLYPEEPLFGLLNGAELVYLDSLGANPSGLLSTSSQGLVIEKNRCIQQLSMMADEALEAYKISQVAVSTDNAQLRIGSFSLERKLSSALNVFFNLQAPTTATNAMKVIRAMQLRKPILLEGSPGVGKTSLVTALASATGNPLVRINLSEQTDLMDLFGSDVPVGGGQSGEFIWRDAPFLQAMQRGHWVLLDEMNLASQSVLEGLNACLDHRGEAYIAELDRTFTSHPDFVVFAAQNPHHQGGGRKGLPASFVNRFTVVYVDSLNIVDLELISNRLFPTVSEIDISNIINFIVKLDHEVTHRRSFGQAGAPWEFNLRDAMRWLSLLSCKSGLTSTRSPSEYLDVIVKQRFRTSQDKAYVDQLYKEVFGHYPERRNLFHRITEQFFQVGHALIQRTSSNHQHTAAHGEALLTTQLATVEAVMTCVERNWPCILVGPSGSGKSSIIRLLAVIAGSVLDEMALNTDIDTMDIVGGFEQLDVSRRISVYIQELETYVKSFAAHELREHTQLAPNIVTLLDQIKVQRLEQFNVEQLTQIANYLKEFRSHNEKFQEYHRRIQVLICECKQVITAQFEWVDGILGIEVFLDPNAACDQVAAAEDERQMKIAKYAASTAANSVMGTFRLFDPPQDVQRLDSYLQVSLNYVPMTYHNYVLRWRTFLSTYDEPIKAASLLRLLENYLDIFSHPQLRRLIQTSLDYSFSMMNIDASPTLSSAQSLHPLVNSYLLRPSQTYPPDNDPYNLAAFYEIVAEISRMAQAVDNLLQRSNLIRLGQMNVHQKPVVYSQGVSNRTLPLFTLLSDVLDALQIWSNNQSIRLDKVIIESVEEIIYLWWDVLRLRDSQTFEESAFYVYLTFYKEWVDSSGPLLPPSLVDSIKSVLKTFKTQLKLTTGFSMELLWNHMRPTVPTTSESWGSHIQLEALAARFDTVSPQFEGSMQELHALRQSLATALSSTLRSLANPGTLIKELDILISELERRESEQLRTQASFFNSQFNYLLKCRDLLESTSSKPRSIDEDAAISAHFACRPTISLLRYYEGDFGLRFSFPHILEDLWKYPQDSTMNDRPKEFLSGLYGIDLLNIQQTVVQGTIEQIPALKSEVRALAKQLIHETNDLTHDKIGSLRSLLISNLAVVLDSHRTIYQAEDFIKIKSALSELSNPVPISHVGINGLLEVLPRTSNKDVNKIIREYFISAIVAVTSDSLGVQERFIAVGKAWVHYARGCLKLFVPNCPVDPAMKSIVKRERFLRRKSELEEKFRANREFELRFSGQGSNLIIEHLQMRIEALGNEPPSSTIVRPAESQMDHLQSDFTILLQTVVSGNSQDRLLESILERRPGYKDEEKLFQSNMEQVIDRLQSAYPLYKDIIDPVIGFLYSLRLGYTLLSMNVVDTSRAMVLENSLLTPTEILTWPSSRPDRAQTSTSDTELVHRIWSLSAQAQLEAPAEVEQAAIYSISNVLHTLYRNWKIRTIKEQEEVRANASTYRYRGAEEEDEEAEIKEMFPDYMEPDENEDTSHPEQAQLKSKDHSELAAEIAKCHANMLSIDEKPGLSLKELVLRGVSVFMGLLKGGLPVPYLSPDEIENLIPAQILTLKDSEDWLLGKQPTGKKYDFYKDENLEETHKLVVIMKRLYNRIRQLLENWPENVTLQDALAVSEQVLNLPNTTPIAKFLFYVEKLHGIVHEWQGVASIQYSLAQHFDFLTQLTIAWRRLELQAWPRLFDIEDEKCQYEADSWWFFLYESIIENPLQLAKSGESLETHISDLMAILNTFIQNSTIGQYQWRLRLLRVFQRHIVTFNEGQRRLAEAIDNLVSFYAEYTPFFIERTATARAKVEKDIAEVILLASWKDTNITALRESAHRSHYKLYKIVRKYRASMAESVLPTLQGSMPEKSLDGLDRTPVTMLEVTMAPELNLAQEICVTAVPTWKGRPRRLVDIPATLKTIQRISTLSLELPDTANVIDAFATNVVTTIKELQASTPAYLTEENKEEVKHLKSRKRFAYTGVLKALRLMGLKSNLSSALLAKQESLEKICAGGLALNTDLVDVAAASKYFYRCLEALPKVRRTAQDHSAELSRSDVLRSIGFIEHLVHLAIQQRDEIAKFSMEFMGFKKMLEAYEAVATCFLDSHDARLYGMEVANQAAYRAVKRVFRWLPRIFDYVLEVLKIHADYAGKPLTEEVEIFTEWRGLSWDIDRQFSDHRPIYDGVWNGSTKRLMETANTAIDKFKEGLMAVQTQFPHIKYLATQVLPWISTASNVPKSTAPELPTSALTDLDSSLRTLCNSIFVALQQLKNTHCAYPTSDTEHSWLLHYQSAAISTLNALHINDIREQIQSCMTTLLSLQPYTPQTSQVARAMFACYFPIISQYQNTCNEALSRVAQLHRGTCKMTYILSSSAVTFGAKGFCTPQEKSEEKSDGGKVDQGTGLGEGEGMENISKDVGADEDMSELAQEKNKDQDGKEVEDEKDAVDIEEDMEGEEGDMQEKEDRGGQEDGDEKEDEEGEMDEETGAVDELDPTAVDEKLWDEKGEEGAREQEGDAKGKKQQEDMEAKKENGKKGNKENQVDDTMEKVKEGGEEEEEDAPADENDEVRKDDAGIADQHIPEVETLDLPEDMNLDQGEKGDNMDEDMDMDMDQLSDVEKEDKAMNEEAAEPDSFPEANDGENQPDDTSQPDETKDPNSEAGEEEGEKQIESIQEAAEKHMDQTEGNLLQQKADESKSTDGPAPSDLQGVEGGTDQQQENNQATSVRQDFGEEKEEKGDRGEGKSDTVSNEQAAGGQSPVADHAKKQNQNTDEEPSVEKSTFRKVGDILERWHRQQRGIQEARKQEEERQKMDDTMELDNVEFEHIPDEDAEADTQAIGAATEEQAHPVDDSMAIDSEVPEKLPQNFEEDEQMDKVKAEDANIPETKEAAEEEKKNAMGKKGHAGSMIGPREDSSRRNAPNAEDEMDMDDDDLEDSPIGRSVIPHQSSFLEALHTRPSAGALALWQHYEQATHDLTLGLTEQLRLILEPTLATKMRGDFRTGKRLNMKRIIPYIASGYKKDKIWMRRTKPSKRQYQVMIAIDDSKSMAEAEGCVELAMQTVAMVTGALRRVEVGEVAVVGFGEGVEVVHPFGRVWGGDEGGRVVEKFKFAQTRTDVRKLVETSIELFETARAQLSVNDDLWQLEVVVSDGVCEDHEALKRLVRRAMEKRIMIVFVIVDVVRESSILEMNKVKFIPGDNGSMRLVMERYLDTFPFGFYLVVKDVKELPGVLAGALRQWLAEVTEAGSA